ncbi:Tim17-domain-containing protein [Mycena leptocephala]|nr:Tim17-domain-containing protein [Mycena leptocephala]
MMVPSADHTRDPCPWVILSECGGRFTMGAVGGGIWYGVKGARSSLRGERFAGALSAVKARAPVVAGNFGVWGDCFPLRGVARGLRQKEDSWNPIISGFMTGGCLAVRTGPKAALQSAIACGIVLGVFEGVGIVMGRFFSAGQRPQQAPLPPSKATQPAPRSSIPGF